MLYHWADYYEENLAFEAQLDRIQAEEVVSALPGPGTGEERAARVRLLSSTVAAFVGNRYHPRFPVTQDGSLCPVFLTFAVKNFRQGRSAVVQDLRRQLIEAAKAQGITIPRSVDP
jgi:hypothetical protein